jgi:hypothetical protein
LEITTGSIDIDYASMGKAFVRLPLKIVEDAALSPSGVRALAILFFYEFVGKYPGHEAAARRFHWSRRWLLMAFRELEQTGWLKRKSGGTGVPASFKIAAPPPAAQGEAPHLTPGGTMPHPSSEESLTSGVRDPSLFLKTLKETLEEDPDYRVFYETTKELGLHVCRHPADEEAREALCMITAGPDLASHLAAIEDYRDLLERIRIGKSEPVEES